MGLFHRNRAMKQHHGRVETTVYLSPPCYHYAVIHLYERHIRLFVLSSYDWCNCEPPSGNDNPARASVNTRKNGS